MILLDIPVYTRDGNIQPISAAKASVIGRYKTEKIKEPQDMVLLRTAAFGSVLISPDTCIVGGGLVKNLKLYQEIILNINLQFGKDVVPSKFLDAMNTLESGTYETWKATKELTKHIKKLLKLTEVENRVALRYIKKLYEYKKDKLLMRGTGHAALMKCFQVIAWKAGLHARYDFANNASILTLQTDCPFTIISHEENKVTSKIIELKHISQFKNKLVKVTSNDLPILPTSAGMFTF